MIKVRKESDCTRKNRLIKEANTFTNTVGYRSQLCAHWPHECVPVLVTTTSSQSCQYSSLRQPGAPHRHVRCLPSTFPSKYP